MRLTDQSLKKETFKKTLFTVMFSLVLNVSTASALLMYLGIEFHNSGADAEKVHLP